MCERHERHNPRNPAEGDGSCWITPEGYIPLKYTEHHEALDDEGIGCYEDAFEMGWIRVGVYHYSLDDPDDSTVYSEIRYKSKNVDYRALEYLKRILTPLLAFHNAELEDNSITYWDKCRTKDKEAIREKVTALYAKKAPKAPQLELALDLELRR